MSERKIETGVSHFQLQERMRELQCLYRVLEVLHGCKYDDEFSAVLIKVAPIIPDGFMRPDVTKSAVIFNGREFSTPGYDSECEKVSSMLSFSDGKTLELHVCRTDYPISKKTDIKHDSSRWRSSGTPDTVSSGNNPESVESDLSISAGMSSGESGVEQESGFAFLKDEQILLDKIAGLLKQFYEHHLSVTDLAKSESLFRSTFYSIGDGVITTDKNGRLNRMNPVAEKLTGWKENEAKGEPVEKVFNIINEKTRKKAENPVDKVLREGMIFELANYTLLMSKDGREIPIVDSGAPITGKNNDVVGVVLVFRSQLEEREAQIKLEESERKFRSIVEGAPNPVFIHADWKIVYVNPPAMKLFGANSADELIGSSIRNHVHADFLSINNKRIEQLYNQQKAVTELLEQPYVRIDGSEVWVETSGAPINFEDKKGALVFVRDITERRRDQEIIRTNLKEKEVLLAEIHHRVKNNMAVISGLLELEAHQSTDTELKQILQKANTRIRSMALIHEKLYQAASFSEFEFGTYMKELSGYIRDHFQEKEREVSLEFDVDKVSIDITQAVPCGIILNEVITNGLKYAFREVREGQIYLSLKTEDGEIVITYRDNGPGFDDELLKSIRAGQFPSLGLQLISGLTQQLKGRVAFRNDGGARVEIRFKQQSSHSKKY